MIQPKYDLIRGEALKRLNNVEGLLAKIVPCPKGHFRVTGEEVCRKGTMLMKLKGGSSTFHYHSPFWTNTETLNPGETNGSNDDDIDAKLQACFKSMSDFMSKKCHQLSTIAGT